MEFAALIRPRKYDSRSATGSVSGMMSSVEEAGRREPCFDKRDSAAGQFCLFGGGGLRYSESRVW